MVLVQECTKYDNHAKTWVKEDIYLEIMHQVFIVKLHEHWYNKQNIVNIHHIDMDVTHKNTWSHFITCKAHSFKAQSTHKNHHLRQPPNLTSAMYK